MVINLQTKLLDGMLDPIMRCLTPEGAARLAGLRASEEAQKRMDELAEKCGEGQLSEEEREEYDAYISAANVLAILQAKARQQIAGGTAA